METFIELTKNITLGGGLAVFSWFGYKTFAKWIDYKERKGGDLGQKTENGINKRIEGLEKFQTEAETNHWHDLESVMKDIKVLRQDFNDYRVEMAKELGKIWRNINGNNKKQL